MGSSKVPTDRMKDALMRSRLTRFLGSAKEIEGLTGAEITLAVRGAFRAVREFLEVDDGAKPLN